MFYKSRYFSLKNEIFYVFLCQNKNIMRKSNKEHLYKSAFKLFLLKRFHGVSLSDIEKESGLTRGAVFYYVDSKEMLYYDVIKEFIFNKQKVESKFQNYECHSVKEYISAYVSGVQQTIQSILAVMDQMPMANVSRCYISFILEACDLFPDVKEWYKLNINKDISMWGFALHKGIENGEIKENIDVLNCAKQFVFLYYGQTLVETASMGLNPEVLLDSMNNLYSLIKK